MDSGARSISSVRRKAVWGSAVRLGIATLLAAATSSCGDMVRQGTGSSYLIIQSLEGASGAETEEFGGTLFSDVVTVVNSVPSVFADNGRVTLVLGMKDPALLPVQLEGLEELVDDLRIVRLPEAGHFAPWEAPYEVADALQDFLA